LATTMASALWALSAASAACSYGCAATFLALTPLGHGLSKLT